MGKIRIILGATALLFNSVAIAEITSANDQAFGIGAITQDTAAGLEWLDVTFNVSRSYNDVSSQFGAGGDFEGWRYATGKEILEFWANLEIPDIDTAYSEADYLPVLNLIGLVGCTGGCGGELDFIFAMSGDSKSTTEVVSYRVQVDEGAFDPPRAIAWTSGLTLIDDSADDIASWLVRPISQPVTIDIKPGSDPNSINPRSKGVIPVAVLGSIDFDATQIDFSTVSFGPDGASTAHDGHVEDVNDDGYMDMVFHFKTQEAGIACDDADATLVGETSIGTHFTGTDTVRTVGCNGTKQDTSVKGVGTMSWLFLVGLSVLGLWRRNRLRDRC